MTKTNELEPKENIDKNEGKKPYESPVFTKYEPLDSVSRMIYYYYFFYSYFTRFGSIYSYFTSHRLKIHLLCIKFRF